MHIQYKVISLTAFIYLRINTQYPLRMARNAINLSIGRLLTAQIQSGPTQRPRVTLTATLLQFAFLAAEDWDGDIVTFGGVEVV